MVAQSKIQLGEFVRGTISALAGAAIVFGTYAKAEGRDGARLDATEHLAINNADQIKKDHDAIVKMTGDVDRIMKDVEGILIELRALRTQLERR